MKNIDVIVQFSILWGLKIGNATTEKDLKKAEEMKLYDSEELSKIFINWAKEYQHSNEDDTVDFFEQKLNDLF